MIVAALTRQGQRARRKRARPCIDHRAMSSSRFLPTSNMSCFRPADRAAAGSRKAGNSADDFASPIEQRVPELDHA